MSRIKNESNSLYLETFKESIKCIKISWFFIISVYHFNYPLFDELYNLFINKIFTLFFDIFRFSRIVTKPYCLLYYQYHLLTFLFVKYLKYLKIELIKIRNFS